MVLLGNLGADALDCGISMRPFYMPLDQWDTCESCLCISFFVSGLLFGGSVGTRRESLPSNRHVR